MTSFDIDSLFTNIPFEETICVEKLFESKIELNNLTKEFFPTLLKLATLDSFSFLMETKTSRKMV